jgi:hypothetical protein
MKKESRTHNGVSKGIRDSKISSFLIAFNALSLIANILYIFGPAKGFVNSDTAAYSNIARIMFAEKTLFPSNYYFANDDLLTFSPSLLIGLIALFFGYGYTSQALSIVCFLVLLQITLFRFTTFHSGSKNIALAVSGTFIAFQSSGLNQLILGNGIGTLITICATLWIIMWWTKLLKNIEPKKHKATFMKILIVISFIFLSSPGRTIIGFVFPISIASIFTLFYSNRVQAKDFLFLRGLIHLLKEMRYFIYLSVVLVFLYILRYSMMSNVLMQNAAYNRGFVKNESVGGNVDNFLNGITWITGIKPEFGVLLVSIRGVVSFLILLLFCQILFNSGSILKNSNFEANFTKAFIIVGLITSGYIYFLTSLNVDYSNVRYLYISILYWLLFAVIKGLSQKTELARISLAFTLFASAFGVGMSNTQIDTEAEKLKSEKIVQFLEQRSNGVFAGTYWNAQKYEFLSNGQVRALPILLDPTVCIKSFDWMVNSRNVYSRAESVTLLLEKNEIDSLMSYGCAERLKLIANVEDKHIYNYQGNW